MGDIHKKNTFVGIACIDAPVPPPEHHLVMNYTANTTVEFHETVFYSCEDGYHFGEDYDLDGFFITCQDTGQWDFSAWKSCFHPDSE